MSKLNVTIDYRTFSERRSLPYYFLALSLCLLFSLVANVLERIFWGGYMDFIHFYMAAKALIAHTPLYQSGSGGYIYPPLFAFLLIPLGHLSYTSAALVLAAINFALYIVIFQATLLRMNLIFEIQLRFWQKLMICLLAALLTLDPLRGVIMMGQSDALVLAGFSLSLLWLERKPTISGILLGITALIKYQSVIFLPFLILRGRWKAAWGFFLGVIIAAFTPASTIGWSRNWEYLKIAFRGFFNIGHRHLALAYATQIPPITWKKNISITSGLTRIITDLGWPPILVLIPLLVLITGIIFLFLKMYRRNSIPFFWRKPGDIPLKKEQASITFEWYILLALLLVFSPECLKRHTILLLNLNLLAVLLALVSAWQTRRLIIWVVGIAQLGYLTGLFIAVDHSYWNYMGGPTWTLLPMIFVVLNVALKKSQEDGVYE